MRDKWRLFALAYFGSTGRPMSSEFLIHSLQDYPSDVSKKETWEAKSVKASKEYINDLEKVLNNHPVVSRTCHCSTKLNFSTCDLDTAIHAGTIYYDGWICKTTTGRVHYDLDVRLEDDYDFHWRGSDYAKSDGFIVTFGNNLAYADQVFGIIVPFHVTLSFRDRK